MHKINIAIDGTSSTGKSTLAKSIAKKLQYIYIDSGAMYRAVTLYAQQNNMINENAFDKEALIRALSNIQLSFQVDEVTGQQTIWLNGFPVEDQIRSMEVSNAVSQVAAVPEIRKAMVALQHQFGQNKGVVMDGRDIGTVVFPNAELKLFLTCAANIRAKRRFEELQNKGISVSFDEVLENIQARDQIDSTRKDSPLVKAKNAIEINTENLTEEALVNQVMKLATSALNS